MKTLVIDAIVGIGFPSMLLAEECRKAGLAAFSGHQWSEGYEWRRDQLEKVSEEKLQELHTAMRESREDLEAAAEPEEEKSLIVLN